MRAIFRVLTGARTGHVFTSDAPLIEIGRDAGLDLRFDPEQDREVSARHASVSYENERWWLRDLDSRNGTFVNGRRIAAATELSDGDRLAFGANGPTVEVRLVEENLTRAFPTPGSSPALVVLPTAESNQEPTTSAGPRRRRRALLLTAFALPFFLAAIIAVLVAGNRRQKQVWERERAALEVRVDSALLAGDQTVQSLQGDLHGLAAALLESQQQVRAAGVKLSAAQRAGDASRLPALRNEYSGALTALNRQRAGVDRDRATIRTNDPAVARIYVQFEGGEVTSGTAFAIRADGTLLTNAHILSAPGGQPLRRMAVQFAHSDQVWTARLLSADRVLDLAVVKVDDIRGAVPTVRGLNLRPDTLAQNAPVLVIGYPRGGESVPSARAGRTRIAPVIGAGTVTTVRNNRVEVRGYGTTGSSGSPVFDRNGEVIAIVFGGRVEAGTHYLVAVPASAAARLLASLTPPVSSP